MDKSVNSYIDVMAEKHLSCHTAYILPVSGSTQHDIAGLGAVLSLVNTAVP